MVDRSSKALFFELSQMLKDDLDDDISSSGFLSS